MSNETTFGDIMKGILGVTAAIAGVTAVGAVAYQADKADKEKRRIFNEAVNSRLNALNATYEASTEDKKELIKEEIARLIEAQTDANDRDFNELNKLFDVILTGSIVDAVRAQSKRSDLLAKPAPVTYALPMQPNATRDELYKEIERINKRLSDIWTSDNEKKSLIELRDSLYKKLY
jgi:hypothetical protein